MEKKTKKIDTPATPKKLSSAEQISALTVLQTSIGWAMLIEQLEFNKQYLEKAILERIDPYTGETMKEEDVDDARRKRKLIIELMETPQKLKRHIEKSEGSEPVNFDPYESDPAALSKQN